MRTLPHPTGLQCGDLVRIKDHSQINRQMPATMRLMAGSVLRVRQNRSPAEFPSLDCHHSMPSGAEYVWCEDPNHPIHQYLLCRESLEKTS